MPTWVPQAEWLGQDAFLIGGGPSLKGFDFDRLAGRNTIGINDAFRLGPRIVKVCFFGDRGWLFRNKGELEHFQGKVIGCIPKIPDTENYPWLLRTDREKRGLHNDSSVGLNFSSGAGAINVAITLGATRIFLLGYDLSRNGEGKSHWHDFNEKSTRDESFARFLVGFEVVWRDLASYPNVRVYNVTNGSSKLPNFERITEKQMWEMAA